MLWGANRVHTDNKELEEKWAESLLVPGERRTNRKEKRRRKKNEERTFSSYYRLLAAHKRVHDPTKDMLQTAHDMAGVLPLIVKNKTMKSCFDNWSSVPSLSLFVVWLLTAL